MKLINADTVTIDAARGQVTLTQLNTVDIEVNGLMGPRAETWATNDSWQVWQVQGDRISGHIRTRGTTTGRGRSTIVAAVTTEIDLTINGRHYNLMIHPDLSTTRGQVRAWLQSSERDIELGYSAAGTWDLIRGQVYYSPIEYKSLTDSARQQVSDIIVGFFSQVDDAVKDGLIVREVTRQVERYRELAAKAQQVADNAALLLQAITATR